MQPQKRTCKNREPTLHKLGDKLTEIIIYFMIIFSAWAFGATEYWSIRIMNLASIGLLILYTCKISIRYLSSYSIFDSRKKKTDKILNKKLLLDKLIFIMMLIILIYILISSINARANFDINSKILYYYSDYKSYLPHSYDKNATLFYFWQHLGLIIFYWAIKDWIINDKHYFNHESNKRLNRLICVIVINGGVIAFISIIQSLYYKQGTGKLLFLLEPTINKDSNTQFGPFAYRSNASTYFNIIWLIGIGLFASINKKSFQVKDLGRSKNVLIIPMILLSMASPILSNSRAGALLTIFLIISCTIFTMIFYLRTKVYKLIILIIPIMIILINIVGLDYLKVRMNEKLPDAMRSRNQINEATIKMIKEYGLYGTGPGTYETVYQFELNNEQNVWNSWAHNDYLEFILTFGTIGSIFIGITIILLVMKFLYEMKNCYSNNYIFYVLSIIGVMLHSIIDFPLQIYSILLLITLMVSILTSLSFSKI